MLKVTTSFKCCSFQSSLFLFLLYTTGKRSRLSSVCNWYWYHDAYCYFIQLGLIRISVPRVNWRKTSERYTFASNQHQGHKWWLLYFILWRPKRWEFWSNRSCDNQTKTQHIFTHNQLRYFLHFILVNWRTCLLILHTVCSESCVERTKMQLS